MRRRIVLSSNSRYSTPSESWSGPRELISIPSEPIRESWVKRYRLFEKKLEKLKREWLIFEQEAIPKYHRWYHSTFANELARVNEWTEKAREKEMILAAIVAHQRIYRLDDLEAYARVKEKLDEKKDPFPDRDDIERYEKRQREQAEADQKRRDEMEKRRQERNQRFWDSVAEEEAYEEAIEQASFDWAERLGAPESDEPIQPTVTHRSSTEARADDLKTLYRKIVRKLHPDSGYEMSAVEKDWWNQAQEAYRNRDLERLKIISLKIQGSGEVVIEKVDHIGTLIDLCASLLEQQDQIESQKRQLKRDPVYRFWASRDRSQNREKLELELVSQLHFQFRRLKEFVDQAERGLKDFDRVLRGGRDDLDFNYEYGQSRSKRRPESGTQSGSGRGRGRGKRRK